ncbi:MAG: hypothetical protein ACTHJM_01285 [Marmoricola sp.]
MKRVLTVLGVLFATCAVLIQTTAFAASATTALLGNTSVPRIPRDGIAGASLCPHGSYVVGARVWVDTFPRVTGFAAYCTNGASSPTLGDLVGDTSDAVAVGDSVCNRPDLAVGLKAANGEVINALAVRCAGAGGTYDAAVIGNQTTIKSNADCDSGTALTGIHGWYNIYGGPHINVYGVQGDCAAKDTTPPTVTTAPFTYVSLNGGGFRIAVHDNLAVASVQATLHPIVGAGAGLVRNATCVAGCGTATSQWYVSTAGLVGVFKVTARAIDYAGNVSAPQ